MATWGEIWGGSGEIGGTVGHLFIDLKLFLKFKSRKKRGGK